LATVDERVKLASLGKSRAEGKVVIPKRKLFSEQDDPVFWMAVAGGLMIIILFLRYYGIF
jgi:hypothetical protein